MSQFEAALDNHRQKYPKITVRDRITGTGRRIITEKGPDGVTHKCIIHENRNSKARARLSEKYHQRNKFDVLDIIERFLRDVIPAVMLSDNKSTIIFYNTSTIDSSKQHKLIKIEPCEEGCYYLFESVSEVEFNELEKQLQQLESSFS